jgi:hypothetical protein
MSNTLADRIKAHIASSGAAEPLPLASQALIARTEAALGFELPSQLKAIYLEVGNGGFGPGRGLIGVEGGHLSDYGDLVQTYRQLERDMVKLARAWEPGLLPFCAWGCATLSCVKCDASLRVSTFQDGTIWPQEYALAGFFELWISGADILSHDATVDFVDVTFKNPFSGRQETKRSRRRR